MIKVTTELNEVNLVIKIEGHAGYAKINEDIICSAVSVLTHLLSNSLENFSMSSDHLSPSVSIVAESTKKNRTLVRAVLDEMYFIGEHYPQYFNLEKVVWK
jgi:uncharacterized protein YsxB (DUF464 family)